jgi:multiple sugar transport system permease protein
MPPGSNNPVALRHGRAAAAVAVTVPRQAAFFVRRRRNYRRFIIPALVVVGAVIIFPWMFTVWMSAFDWKIGSVAHFVGFDNYVGLATNQRFLESIGHTFYFTALAVVFPLVLGTIAALIFHREFPLRGVLRAVFTMPMMATPVAIALVWTMMFHPQQGVLNYLLSLIGLPPSLWVYSPTLVIPSLVLVEVWHWTPLVMLIVLGGLAALPVEPYESARLDGATEWQLFRYITLPLIAPFLVVAAVIRTIDAVKAFDTIYVISQGGPGTASETINLYLYLQAFAFYNVGNASAVVVVFFAIILALALLLLHVRQRTKWVAM